MEEVILVDQNDKEIGTEEKIKAHKEATLHRAFSIFVFNPKGELLLQKRAKSKYHSAGLWTNTCCSHPRPGEPLEEAAHRKLKQEMGFDTELKEMFSFIYKAEFANGLTEHEFDHVFIGKWDGEPTINPEEVGKWKWVNVQDLQKDMKEHPDNHTEWFKISLERVLEHRQ